MRIVNKIARFDRGDNPTAENLLKLDPTLKIAAGYKGSNENLDLANLFVSTIKAGLAPSVAALTVGIPVDKSPDPLFNLFTAQALRFHIKDSAIVFYTLSSSLELSTDTHFFYLLSLAQHFSGDMSSIAPTLEQLYKMEEGRNADSIIELATIEHFFELNEVLRSEGIMLPTKDIFICSSHWGDSEVLDLLFRDLDISEAVRMYEIGFTTMEDIIEYYGALPDSWITKMLG